MRQGQQSRRGRNRGGRKPQNTISQNSQSSGPDVKIRGTAMHIAGKIRLFGKGRDVVRRYSGS